MGYKIDRGVSLHAKLVVYKQWFRIGYDHVLSVCPAARTYDPYMACAAPHADTCYGHMACCTRSCIVQISCPVLTAASHGSCCCPHVPPRPKPRPPPAASPCGSRPCHTLHASTSPNTGTCASGHAPYMRASPARALRARTVDRRISLHPQSRRELPRSRYIELSTQVDEILGAHGEIAGAR